MSLDKIAREILRFERFEEALVEIALDTGHDVVRRIEIDMRAVLTVSPTQTAARFFISISAAGNALRRRWNSLCLKCKRCCGF
jgi:predicted component of type VI protein secretion system